MSSPDRSDRRARPRRRTPRPDCRNVRGPQPGSRTPSLRAAAGRSPRTGWGRPGRRPAGKGRRAPRRTRCLGLDDSSREGTPLVAAAGQHELELGNLAQKRERFEETLMVLVRPSAGRVEEKALALLVPRREPSVIDAERDRVDALRRERRAVRSRSDARTGRRRRRRRHCAPSSRRRSVDKRDLPELFSRAERAYRRFAYEARRAMPTPWS